MDFFDRLEAYRDYLVAEAEKQGYTECRGRIVSAKSGSAKIVLTATIPTEDLGCLPNAFDFKLKARVGKQVSTTTFDIEEKE